MILQVFTVYDHAVQSYLPPFFVRSKGEAIRSFTEAVNAEGNQFNKHAADYTLFALGTYDDDGAVFMVDVPHRVISALECLVDDVFPPEKRVDGSGAAGFRRVPM